MGFISNFFSKGQSKEAYQKLSLLEGSINNGAWGVGYHKNYNELSLRVSCIDECIDLIGRALSSGVPYMKDEKGVLTQENEPLVQLLLNPNKHQNFKEFAKDFVRNTYASGYCQLLPTSVSDANIRRLDKLDSDNRPELEVLNCDNIEYVDQENYNDQFRYENNDGSTTLYNYDDVIPFWDKIQDPKNFRIGVSRLVALECQVNNIITANEAKNHKIKQSGKFIVTQVNSKDGNSFGDGLNSAVNPQKPEYTQRDLLENKLSNTGFAQDKSTTVLAVEIKATNVMESIQNYSYDDEVKEDKRTIKNAFTIPKGLQNISDDTILWNEAKEAYLELFTLNIIPLATNLTESIQKYYDPNNKKKLVLDFSNHPAFDISKEKQEAKTSSKVKTLTDLFNAEIISKEDVLKILKDEKVI